jgi:hypothetical protein
MESILNFLVGNIEIISTGVFMLLTLVFGVKADKLYKAGKVLFDAIQDKKITEEEAKQIADAFKGLFEKKK